MASTYPATKQTFTNPVGSDNLSSPDHASGHSTGYDTLGSIQDTIGTTAGTNVLMHFAAGQFPTRATGVAATGTLVQTIVGGTYNNFTAGTPAIAGGTYNNFTAGTPTVAGTIVLPSTVIPTAALVNNAVTTGSVLINTTLVAGTGVAGAFADFGGLTGTLAVTTACDLWASFNTTLLNSLNASDNINVRLRGTSSVGTFHIPDANGARTTILNTGDYRDLTSGGFVSGVSVGTYICTIQGSAAAGSIISNPNLGMTVSILQLRK